MLALIVETLALHWHRQVQLEQLMLNSRLFRFKPVHGPLRDTKSAFHVTRQHIFASASALSSGQLHVKASNQHAQLRFVSQSEAATLNTPIITGSPHFTCMQSHLDPARRAKPKSCAKFV
jgi:hypothetical protein